MKSLCRSTISIRDRQIIAQYLRDAEKDVRKSKVETMKLLAAVRTLENKRKTLEKSMEFYRSLLSPIHKMPPEILSTIFMFCCNENELAPQSRRPPAAIVLSTVCGRWREIALSIPALWSSVSIRNNGTDPWSSSTALLAEITQVFMQRSKNAPLVVVLAWRPDNFDALLPALLYLAKNSERWSSISLHVPSAMFAAPALGSVSGRIPLLHRLNLRACNGPLDKLDIFALAPALSSIDFNPDTHMITLPWQQIKSLTLRESYCRNPYLILSRCPNLEQLTLSSIGGMSDELESTEPVVLHKLHSLFITLGEEEEEFTFPFKFLTLPHLSSIVLEKDYYLQPNDWDQTWLHIQDFFHRSQCNVTSLRLHESPLHGPRAIAFLLLLPALEKLHIQELQDEEIRVVTPLFLRHLTVEHGCFSQSSPFLPRLKDLSLNVYGRNLDAEGLANAVISRWQPAGDIGVESLQSVQISVTRDVHTCLQELICLENFRAAGLQVDVKFVRQELY
ncbi:hypothetical protein Moror_4975 [Moniliophthora roreri MCA 2997]|uniref:F-box domain-containing protein n=1 Tax=Moniliophthora roreri (strain MCA 2997) TaxID=1381753 RepID=V2WXT9_MONRO|nr:hypothetical protein Moror_4975 [Moniliophthora roreri MCA 2997]